MFKSLLWFLLFDGGLSIIWESRAVSSVKDVLGKNSVSRKDLVHWGFYTLWRIWHVLLCLERTLPVHLLYQGWFGAEPSTTLLKHYEPQFHETAMNLPWKAHENLFMAHEYCKQKFWGHEFSVKKKVLYFKTCEFHEMRLSWTMKMVDCSGLCFNGH